MNLKDIWNELAHILGIATAVAPIVAVADPNAAAGIGSAEAMLTLVHPVITQVVNSAAAPQTSTDIATQTQLVLNTALAIGQATGKVTAEKAAAIQQLAPALVATAIAASQPVSVAPAA